MTDSILLPPVPGQESSTNLFRFIKNLNGKFTSRSKNKSDWKLLSSAKMFHLRKKQRMFKAYYDIGT